MDKLDFREISDAALDDWRPLAQGLHARFLAPDYVTAAAFVAAVAQVADSNRQQPDIRVLSGAVDLTLITREDGLWITRRDLNLARTISDLAHANGLTPDPVTVVQLEIALDTADENRVGPFWSALLTGDPANRVSDSVFDPSGRVPSLWFQPTDQPTDEHPPPRQRWHFDVWLPPEAAEDRIAAAVAAGGLIVDDSSAPSFTVLADADGNRVCICTTSGRP